MRRAGDGVSRRVRVLAEQLRDLMILSAADELGAFGEGRTDDVTALKAAIYEVRDVRNELQEIEDHLGECLGDMEEEPTKEPSP